jgi:Protein of unknown function (DUF3108)
MKAGIVVMALAVCGAGAFYWVKARENAPPPDMPVPVPAASTEESKGPSKLPGATAIPAEHGTTVETKKPAAPVDAAIPLKLGEVLDFTANVSKLDNVATLRLQVAERKDILGKSAWHLQAFAHTQNPLRMVFVLDDRFDSYSDAGTLASLQYEMHLDERGQKVESIQQMTSTGKEPATANASKARVLPGTRDPLGMMQYLRNVDWMKTSEVHSPVYDGHKLYDVRAHLVGKAEPVTVAAGSYTASKIDLQVFDNGVESKDAHFTLYLANDANRTPVLLEAVMPFATARVELSKAK